MEAEEALKNPLLAKIAIPVNTKAESSDHNFGQS